MLIYIYYEFIIQDIHLKKEMKIMEDIKPFTEMTSSELFIILTGGRGAMEQMYLRNILKKYLEKHKDTADLVTMVREVAKEEE